MTKEDLENICIAFEAHNISIDKLLKMIETANKEIDDYGCSKLILHRRRIDCY